MTRLQYAVREAQAIRRRLVRWRRSADLGGDCGIASLLLAAAIGDAVSLRHHDLDLRPWSPHVWNEIDGTIVDITATQFNDLDAWQPYTRGVLVTKQPRIYHGYVSGAGAETLEYLRTAGSWYDEEDEAELFTRALDALSTTRACRSPRSVGLPSSGSPSALRTRS